MASYNEFKMINNKLLILSIIGLSSAPALAQNSKCLEYPTSIDAKLYAAMDKGSPKLLARSEIDLTKNEYESLKSPNFIKFTGTSGSSNWISTSNVNVRGDGSAYFTGNEYVDANPNVLTKAEFFSNITGDNLSNGFLLRSYSGHIPSSTVWQQLDNFSNTSYCLYFTDQISVSVKMVKKSTKRAAQLTAKLTLEDWKEAGSPSSAKLFYSHPHGNGHVTVAPIIDSNSYVTFQKTTGKKPSNGAFTFTAINFNTNNHTEYVGSVRDTSTSDGTIHGHFNYQALN